MPLVTLSSSRGAESLSVNFQRRNDCGPDPVAEALVMARLSNWASGEPRPVGLDLGSIQLSLSEASRLLSDVRTWLELPLDRLAQTPLVAYCDLAFSPTESLKLSFGTRSDVISEDKPVLTFTFSIGSLSGEAHLVTDQSCLAQFAAGLASALKSLGHEQSAA
jgi:hypothetical protein